MVDVRTHRVNIEKTFDTSVPTVVEETNNGNDVKTVPALFVLSSTPGVPSPLTQCSTSIWGTVAVQWHE